MTDAQVGPPRERYLHMTPAEAARIASRAQPMNDWGRALNVLYYEREELLRQNAEAKRLLAVETWDADDVASAAQLLEGAK